MVSKPQAEQWCFLSHNFFGTGAPHGHCCDVPRAFTFTSHRPALSALYDSFRMKPDHVRNSCRKLCEETPLRCLTNRWIPNCGSTSTSTCTWSGMISKAMISARYLFATCLSTCSHRLATRPTSTARRYLGVHTQWYLLELNRPRCGLICTLPGPY